MCFSNGNSGVFDHGELEQSIFKRLQQGNNDCLSYFDDHEFSSLAQKLQTFLFFGAN